MIGSVGRILRQVGIDTVILKGDFADHDECIKLSQKEDRIILTASNQLMVNKVSGVHRPDGWLVGFETENEFKIADESLVLFYF